MAGQWKEGRRARCRGILARAGFAPPEETPTLALLQCAHAVKRMALHTNPHVLRPRRNLCVIIDDLAGHRSAEVEHHLYRDGAEFEQIARDLRDLEANEAECLRLESLPPEEFAAELSVLVPVNQNAETHEARLARLLTEMQLIEMPR